MHELFNGQRSRVIRVELSESLTESFDFVHGEVSHQVTREGIILTHFTPDVLFLAYVIFFTAET